METKQVQHEKPSKVILKPKHRVSHTQPHHTPCSRLDEAHCFKWHGVEAQQEGSVGYCWNRSLFEQQLMRKVTIMLCFQTLGLF